MGDLLVFLLTYPRERRWELLDPFAELMLCSIMEEGEKFQR